MTCQKICIFDVDNTVTVGKSHTCQILPSHPSPAWPENSGTTQAVVDTIDACLKKGYKIAFATAEAATRLPSPQLKQPPN
jgi:hypothetical protein